MPAQCDLGALVRRPQPVELVGAEDVPQRVVVVLVDRLEGARVLAAARGGGVAAGEVHVRVAPFLRHAGPVDGGGAQAERGWEGRLGRGERGGGARLQDLGDGQTPVYDGAEDLCGFFVALVGFG